MSADILLINKRLLCSKPFFKILCNFLLVFIYKGYFSYWIKIWTMEISYTYVWN